MEIRIVLKGIWAGTHYITDHMESDGKPPLDMRLSQRQGQEWKEGWDWRAEWEMKDRVVHSTVSFFKDILVFSVLVFYLNSFKVILMVN